MPSIIISVEDEFKKRLDEFPWVNWSEVAREKATKQEEKLELFKELEELTKDSALTDEDCLRLGKLVNKKILERLKKEG